MAVPLTNYAVGWNTTNNAGRIVVQTNTGQQVNLQVNTPDELMLVLTILGKSGVQIDPHSNELELPFRPVGT